MEKFGELLSKTIDVTMKQVFGNSASELIYRLMERQTSLKREEIGERFEAYEAYLERLVGLRVSQFVLAASVKDLCTNLRREYEEIEKYFSVLDELYEVKFRLLASFQKEERSASN